MTHVPHYPPTDPRQSWVHISSSIAANDTLLPLYMPPSPTCVNIPNPVNTNPVNTIHPEESQCPGTPSVETDPADKCTTLDRTVNTSPVNTSHVNIPLTSPSIPPCIYTSSVLHVHTVDKNSSLPSPITHPSTLYDSLSPKLLHQQSLHTVVQQLLLPIIHLPSIPIDILTKLHAVLRDSPRLLTYLPPPPSVRLRLPRVPPVSYADPDQPQIGPPPLPSLPFWHTGRRRHSTINAHHTGQ